MPQKIALCISLESNRYYKDILKNAPNPKDRVYAFRNIPVEKYVTIEPVMDFDLSELTFMISMISPTQVNIGADSGNNGLTEPSKEKVLELINALSKITKVVQKENLNRLLK